MVTAAADGRTEAPVCNQWQADRQAAVGRGGDVRHAGHDPSLAPSVGGCAVDAPAPICGRAGVKWEIRARVVRFAQGNPF